MNLLKILAIVFLASGILMIGLAEQLAILYEGPQYTMSDLGFIVSGMMVAGIGVVLLVIFLVLHLRKR